MEKTLSRLKKDLGPKCACYVLITCSEPAADGKMNVEMHFEGDETLAGFLLENANQTFEGRNSLKNA